MEYIHHYDSPLGGITMASDGNALTGYAGEIEKKSQTAGFGTSEYFDHLCAKAREVIITGLTIGVKQN